MCFLYTTTYKCEKCNHIEERTEGGYPTPEMFNNMKPPTCPKCNIAMASRGSMEFQTHLAMKMFDKIVPQWLRN